MYTLLSAVMIRTLAILELLTVYHSYATSLAQRRNRNLERGLTHVGLPPKKGARAPAPTAADAKGSVNGTSQPEKPGPPPPMSKTQKAKAKKETVKNGFGKAKAQPSSSYGTGAYSRENWGDNNATPDGQYGSVDGTDGPNAPEPPEPANNLILDGLFPDLTLQWTGLTNHRPDFKRYLNAGNSESGAASLGETTAERHDVPSLTAQMQFLNVPTDSQQESNNVRRAASEAVVLSPGVGRLEGMPPQFALLGHTDPNGKQGRVFDQEDPRVMLNTNVPFSAFVCGVQGSGKSHTTSCMIGRSYVFLFVC